MIAMNSEARNFLVFRWQDVAAAIEPPLRMNGTSQALLAPSAASRSAREFRRAGYSSIRLVPAAFPASQPAIRSSEASPPRWRRTLPASR
jgi:hypothetical protein